MKVAISKSYSHKNSTDPRSKFLFTPQEFVFICSSSPSIRETDTLGVIYSLRSPVFVRRAISSRLIIYPSPTILKSQVAAHQVSLLH